MFSSHSTDNETRLASVKWKCTHRKCNVAVTWMEICKCTHCFSIFCILLSFPAAAVTVFFWYEMHWIKRLIVQYRLEQLFCSTTESNILCLLCVWLYLCNVFSLPSFLFPMRMTETKKQLTERWCRIVGEIQTPTRAEIGQCLHYAFVE